MARLILFLLVLSVIGLGVRAIARHLAMILGPRPGQPEPVDDEEADSGAFLHRVLMDAYGAEREPWALERAARVEATLQANRPEQDRYRVEILWIPECNAFTGRGPWIYVSRRLLERCRSDDALAMIVAHEIAHRDLGHTDGLGGLLWLLERMAISPEMEADADAHGFNLCLAAGYDPARCLSAFEVMEESALDWHDLAGVFGPEAEIAAALDGKPEWRVALERWRHTRRRGYAPVRERRAVLWAAYREALAAQSAAESAGSRRPW
jgi:predicted Zn-dependent protease